jgi:hypothetical protein
MHIIRILNLLYSYNVYNKIYNSIKLRIFGFLS